MTDAYTVVGRTKGSMAVAAGSYPPLGLDISYVYDDFLGGTDSQNPASTTTYDGGVKSGSLGQLGWTVGAAPNPPGSGTKAAYVAPSATILPESAGILGLTAAVDSDRIWIVAPARVATATPSFGVGWMSNLAFEMRWVFLFQDLSRGSIFRVGFVEAFTGATPANPPAGVYVEFNDAVDTNYQYVFDNGSVHSKTDSGIAVGTGTLKAHVLKITRALDSSQIGFSIDDRVATLVSFYSSGYPRIAPYAESQFGTGGSALAFLQLDFYDCLITGLTRYTPA